MSVILGCIQSEHNHNLLVAALLMCLFGCVSARAMVVRAHDTGGKLRTAWLLGAGMVFGTGVWATHFIAMLAYTIGLPMAFNPAITALSVLAAILLSAAGFTLSFTRAGGAVGGLVVGLAILTMHYVGMAALEIPATAVWNSGLVLASVLLGLSFSGLAGHVAAMPVTLRTNLLTVLCRTLGILGVHFPAMAAVHYVPVSATNWNRHPLFTPLAMTVVVMAAAGFVIGQALVLALVDRYLADRARGEQLRMRNHIAALETTQTSLEKTSAELGAALDAAEAASKSKSAFLASMSHELRTPLNAVIGFSETMLMETFGPVGAARYKEYLADIHRSGVHLLAVINDILDIARFDAGHGALQEEVFDPAAKILDTMRMLQVQATKSKVTLVAELAPDLPWLSGDRRRMRQILLNLLSNALKFTPAGGTVTVRAFCRDAFVLQVADTGIGIAPQDFVKALEPFGQVDSSLARKYEGTGLGLPLTRQLVEMHGGTLTLDSTPGEGTTVTVTLPAWRLAMAAPAAA